MSDYIKEALLQDNHHKKLREESKGLVDKWDKTGLLEGLDGNYNRSGMAILLENQARQLIDEASKTGTSAGSEEWSGVALPLVRRIFAEIAAQDFVSVQPMNLPSGLVFYLDFKYGSNVLNKSSGDSLAGATGPNSPVGTTVTSFPEGGFYGAGQYGYTAPTASAPFEVAAIDATPSLADINYDTDFSASNAGNFKKYTGKFVNSSSLAMDDLAIRAATVSNIPGNLGNAITSSFPAFTTSGSDGTITFIANLSDDVAAHSGATVAETAYLNINYMLKTAESNRGDFEQSAAGFSANPETDLNIPEVNLEMKSQTIVAKTRKLKAVWTPELAQDLNAYHSVDAEAELTAMLSEYISLEIDLEILDMLVADAVTTDYWSAKVGYEYDGTGNFVSNLHATNAMAYTKSDWYQTLLQKVQKVSNKIHQLTLRGGANFLVCSPTVATVLESIPGYAASTDGNKAQFSAGLQAIGQLQNRFTVYKNPYMTENQILMGFRGSNFLETGAVYAPYVPLIMTPLVYDPKNFQPRKGVMTRYAKKMVRPEFYGKILCHGLETV